MKSIFIFIMIISNSFIILGQRNHKTKSREIENLRGYNNWEVLQASTTRQHLDPLNDNSFVKQNKIKSVSEYLIDTNQRKFPIYEYYYSMNGLLDSIWTVYDYWEEGNYIATLRIKYQYNNLGYIDSISNSFIGYVEGIKVIDGCWNIVPINIIETYDESNNYFLKEKKFIDNLNSNSCTQEISYYKNGLLHKIMYKWDGRTYWVQLFEYNFWK